MTHTQNTIANQILNLMDSKINEMMEKIVSNMVEEHAKRNQQFKPTARDFMIVKYGLVIDLLKSVEKYTLSTDVVTKLHDYVSPKGFTIYATIEREGQEYRYSTDVIIAGGYNIQCLHYRYITNTNLPRINASFDMVNAYKAEVKKINAEQRILNEIKYKQDAIDRELAMIETEDKMSDDEIIADCTYLTKMYEDLKLANAFGSKQEFIDWQKEQSDAQIRSHRNNTNYRRRWVNDLKKGMKKLEEKLSKLN